jgi:hypothetical protein
MRLDRQPRHAHIGYEREFMGTMVVDVPRLG